VAILPHGFPPTPAGGGEFPTRLFPTPDRGGNFHPTPAGGGVNLKFQLLVVQLQVE